MEIISTTQLVAQYSTPIFRFCLKLAYSKEDAEDLLQDTFVWAFQNMEKVNRHPQRHLFAAAMYLWKSKKRRFARRKRLAPTESLDMTVAASISGDDDVEAAVLKKEDARLVQALVDQLPDRLKIPIILHYTCDMDIKTIASTLNVPEGTIKSRLHKARKTIEKGLVKNQWI